MMPDRSGQVTSTPVIRSKARFTYEQVMNVICGGSAAGIGRRENRIIREINDLAQTLRAKRFAAGALDIEIPEAEVVLDGNGEMSGLVTRPYDESHQMIEECMVAANEAVAKELWTKGIKILARLHEPPDVPNYVTPVKGPRLVPGMVLAIEPMLNLGTNRIKQDSDGWTIRTRDGSLSAHFEHSILITDNEPEILTWPKTM